MNDASNSNEDLTELVDIADIRRQAESLQIIQNARQQKTDPKPAGEQTEQLSKEQLSRLAKIAKSHAMPNAACATQNKSRLDVAQDKSLPAHLRPPAPPPNLAELARTETFKKPASTAPAPQENAQRTTADQKAQQPDWLKASKAVDLGRPESGAPKVISGERHPLKLIAKDKRPLALRKKKQKETEKKTAKNLFLAFSALMVSLIAAYSFLKNAPNAAHSTRPLITEQAAQDQTPRILEKKDAQKADAVKKGAAFLKKHPLLLRHSAENPTTENKTQLKTFKSILNEQGFLLLNNSISLDDKHAQLNTIQIELEPILVKVQHRKRGDYLQIECSTRRIIVPASTDAQKPQDAPQKLNDLHEELGATTSIHLPNEDDESTRAKGLHQCMQKLGRKLARSLRP